MSVFVLGTGQTSLALGTQLKAAGVPYFYGTRTAPPSPDGAPSIKFDLLDSSTWEAPWQVSFPNGEKPKAFYTIVPKTDDSFPPLRDFAEFARKKGLERIVVCAGSTAVYGELGHGLFWKYLNENGWEYAFLMPTWFADNFHNWYIWDIKAQGTVSSGSEDGKIAWVTAKDVALTAFRALTNEKAPNTNIYVIGPENLSFDEACAKLSAVIGREVKHVRHNPQQRKEAYLKQGTDEYLAHFLSHFAEPNTAKGSEENTDPKRLEFLREFLGREPQSFDEYLQENKDKFL